MKRKAKVKVVTMLEISLDDGVDNVEESVNSILQDMDYSFTECEQADGVIINTEIIEDKLISVDEGV